MAMAINFMIEFHVFGPLLFCLKPFLRDQVMPAATSSAELDSDVLAEQQRVDAMSAPQIESNNLVMRQLSKMYGKFVSVNRLSIAVERYTIFTCEVLGQKLLIRSTF